MKKITCCACCTWFSANQNFVINVSNNLGRPVFCDGRCEALSCSNESAVLVKEFQVLVPKRCPETIRLPAERSFCKSVGEYNCQDDTTVQMIPQPCRCATCRQAQRLLHAKRRKNAAGNSSYFSVFKVGAYEVYYIFIRSWWAEEFGEDLV